MISHRRRPARACARRLPFVAALLLGLAAPAAAQQKTCNVFPGWWEGQQLAPVFVTNAPQSVCDFQIWAWTAYVFWMKKDKDGQPQFLSLPVYSDLTLSGAPAAAKIGPRTLALKPRDQKPQSIGSTQQAGGGVLVDQNGRVVYYTTHMDPLYFGFSQKYFGPARYQTAAPTLNYPIGATVIKSSWRVVQPNEDTGKLFTTTATIDLVKSDGKGRLVPNGKQQSDVKVALVGLHIVGVLKDHPEFAWATFEHDNNAPDLGPNMPPNSPDPVSPNTFTFYKGGTPARDSNQTNALSIDEATQVVSPVTNVFRQFAYGGANPDTTAAIASANGNFRAVLQGNGHAQQISAVFGYYRLIGTQWLDAGTLKPGDGNMDTEAQGSPELANATLETFKQATGKNCFRCHNTSGGPGYPGKDINTSHVILSVLPAPPKGMTRR